jgi:hydrogenase nickel incorporation protein HypB
VKIEVVRDVLERNDRAAEENRKRFDDSGVTCINLLGGAGSGKTTLLEAVLPRLKGGFRAAVLVGDLATTRDAERIAALDVPAVQILTNGGCHLNATLVQRGLTLVGLDDLDVLIVENVGNPICPANFDLGEHLRVSVLSVAEGDDKPAKYPLLFKNAGLVALTKYDLLEYTNFDVAAAERDIARVNPNAEVVHTSARSGQGVRRLAELLRQTFARDAATRTAAAPSSASPGNSSR